jgi:RNA recognition motif-containing protein
MCGGRVIFLSFIFISPEGLRNYFSEFGKVDACTIVRDADGKSRGFAFLTFEDPASVNAVMVREHFLDGKAVRVLCTPSTSHTFSDMFFRFRNRSTPNARFHGRNTYETRGTLLVA